MNLFHFFVPHKKNKHRAKLLHNATLLTLILGISFVSSLGVFLQKNHPEVLGVSYQISEQELLNLTNYERSEEKMDTLTLNKQLSDAAQRKADYMFEHDFWAHFAPDGTTPWKFIKDEGYEYVYAGENLAKGFTTSPDVVRAWMNSPTHKANLLSGQYNEIGFAVKEGRLQGENTILIVQMFGKRDGYAVGADSRSQPIAQNQVVQGTAELGEMSLPVANEESVMSKPLIDITAAARILTFVLLSMLLSALVIDFIIIEKKKISRSVGNNLDHVLLVTIFIAFIFMAKLGHVI